MQASQNKKLESSIRGVWFTILFYITLPFWVTLPFIINWQYFGEFTDEKEINNLWINFLGYGIIFIISCFTLLQFHGMSKEMMKGDFYSKACIHKLYRGSQLLQLTGFSIIMWSFISRILIPYEGKIFFSFEFCSGYFLLILSVIFWYVTKSLRAGALIQQENDLTI
ncbi:hypothetical protein [Nonlabens sp. Asnod3-A02]|uniref:hypothetical protein n=1 Tax=Nonlabens sp. Asnod3-A02 TaxID=3160579 RepID=UPI00386612C5